MAKLKKLPIGIQTIEKILKDGDYIYVDKTDFAYQLINSGAPHHFLSRPRRFGKSLFLSTLKEIFKGDKELFKGCAIYESDYNWIEHPILHFDFGRIESNTSEALLLGLEAVLKKMGMLHNITVEGPSLQFQTELLIEELAKKK